MDGVPATWHRSATLVAGKLVQMPQFVGVSHHVDGRDLAVLDVERGSLKLAIGLQRDEAWQAVDEAYANQRRAVLAVEIRQIFVRLHDGIETDDRLHRGWSLATAVRMD